jgi:hypothetical protein
MQRFGFSAFVLAMMASVTGCGPTATELKERTLSSMNLLVDTWDGSATFQASGLDAYGNPLAATISEGLLNYDLEVRSYGRDALPKNSDDLVIHRLKPHGKNTLHKEVEKASESLGRGGIRGAIQGAKEGLLGKSKEKASKD